MLAQKPRRARCVSVKQASLMTVVWGWAAGACKALFTVWPFPEGPLSHVAALDPGMRHSVPQSR